MKRTENKCPLTITGRHLWEWGRFENKDTTNEIFWKLEAPRCCLCGLVDDRSWETMEKPVRKGVN